MTRPRIALLIFAAAAFVAALGKPVLAVLVQQQDQIAVTIVVEASPAAVSARAPHARDSAIPIEARMALRAIGSASLVDAPLSVQVGQNRPQQAVRVEAEVSPNPKATQLYSDTPTVTIAGTVGSTVEVPCAYHVTVDTSSTTHWQLKQGVSNDFAAGFPGGDLANNTYVSAPNPTSTPFAVYADDGSAWAALSASTGEVVYCVDLTITIPSSVASGAYSTNAVYTLYY